MRMGILLIDEQDKIFSYKLLQVEKLLVIDVAIFKIIHKILEVCLRNSVAAINLLRLKPIIVGSLISYL